MSLSIGIVGLPNVGKSTLFNALLGKQQALAANYPFATIEPNVGVVPVPDERLAKLAKVVHTEKMVPAMVEFVDIAGLVKGAASGEGLGNKFLTHIREVDLICHVLRAFDDGEVVRFGGGLPSYRRVNTVGSQVGPEEDYQIVEAELIIKDLETLLRSKRASEGQAVKDFYEKLFAHLDGGKPARTMVMTEKELEWIRGLFLLTMKDEVAVVNLSEGHLDQVAKIESELGLELGMPVVGLSAKIESELAELGKGEALVYLKELGVEESGLDRLIKLVYGKLGLISFLTAGEQEVRAWTIKDGSKAPRAAGVIHTDFEKKFIKAKVCDYADFIECGGWKNAAEKGKVRMEGRNYVMKEGDVVEFMIGS